MTEDGDLALIAGQLADLTQTVEAMAKQLQAVLARAASDRTRADIQDDRITRAARELIEVTDRLHATANALRNEV